MLDKLDPYMGTIKLVGAGIIAAALIALAWSWHSRGQEIEKLKLFQDTVITAVTVATVEPDKNGDRKRLKVNDVVQSINTLKTNLDNARSALDRLDRETREAKRRSDASDAALRASLAAAEQRYASAAARIKGLESRRPAASPGEAAAAISEDSKAAWQGWNQ